MSSQILENFLGLIVFTVWGEEKRIREEVMKYKDKSKELSPLSDFPMRPIWLFFFLTGCVSGCVFSSLSLCYGVCTGVCEHLRMHVCLYGLRKRQQFRVTGGDPLRHHGSQP